ncbi:hypothetical protein M758_5G132200 [Ceratodon purpureus]|nr:hypothetical protein M758_5G132200 [Ceratodon purpureus]
MVWGFGFMTAILLMLEWLQMMCSRAVREFARVFEGFSHVFAGFARVCMRI